MKKIISLICIGAMLVGVLSACGIWAEETPSETTETVFTQ